MIPMTSEQQELWSRLRAIGDRHGPSDRGSRIEIAGGPRVFDVRCSDAERTIWHWAGTTDQIAGALEKWIDHER
jgi:hypothetical protein